MKKLFFILLILLLAFSFSFGQKIITKTELTNKQEDIEYCFLGWWTLKFENGAVVRMISRDDRDITIFEPKEIWWIGKKYIVIKKPTYREVRLIEEES